MPRSKLSDNGLVVWRDGRSHGFPSREAAVKAVEAVRLPLVGV